jgi:hypothetical protein
MALFWKPKKQGKPRAQSQLQFIDPLEPVKLWEYAVLVCNTSYELGALAQLYRDRADCENGFDELKNQWGWGGYTTQDIERCDLSAKAVALIYNWWSWYVRLAHPKARLEAITSRPKLLAAVGRKPSMRAARASCSPSRMPPPHRSARSSPMCVRALRMFVPLRRS